RRSGGSVFCGVDTTRSPTRISPSVGSTKPAISRSVVVLPQPDGPSRQTRVPCSIVNAMLSTTASGPYFFVNPRSSTDATRYPPNLCRSFPHERTARILFSFEHRLAFLHEGLAAFLVVGALEAGVDQSLG